MSKVQVTVAAALALAAGSAVAVAAQGGGTDTTTTATERGPDFASECRALEGKEFGRCVSQKATAFSRCVRESDAKAPGRDPACRALLTQANGPDEESAEEKSRTSDSERGGDSNPTNDVTVSPTTDGREFGRQVSENARENGGAPTPPERGGSSNPTTDVTVSPTTDGREFGRQVSENARENGGGPPSFAGPPSR